MKKLSFILLLSFQILAAQESKIWTTKQAADWYAKQPFLMGANFFTKYRY